MTVILNYLPLLIALMALVAFVQIELKRTEKKLELYRDEFIDYCGQNGHSLAELGEKLEIAKQQAYHEFILTSGGIAELTDRIIAIEQAMTNHDATHKSIDDRFDRMLNLIQSHTAVIAKLEKKKNGKR